MLPVREAILKWRPDESDDASGDDASGDDASPPAAPSADLKITGELQRLFARLVLGDARAASTRDLVAAFGWSGAEALEQQDVSECLNVLCDRGLHGSARAALDELCGGTTVTVLERKDGTQPPRSGEPAPPGVRGGGERAAERGGGTLVPRRGARAGSELDRRSSSSSSTSASTGRPSRPRSPRTSRATTRVDSNPTSTRASSRLSAVLRELDEGHRFVRTRAESTSTRPSSRVLEFGGFPPDQSLDSTQATTSRSTARRRASASPTRSARRSRRRPARSSSR